MTQNTLTVMSYNIDRAKGGDLEAILRLFSAEKPLPNDKIPVPDVLLLQEVVNNELHPSLDQFIRDFQGKISGSEWDTFYLNEEGREGPDENANAILSRYPLQSSGSIAFENQSGYEGRNAVYVDIWTAGKTIRIYSTHLESGKDAGDALIILETTKAQFNEIKANAAQSETSMQIIGGDFNNPLLPNFKDPLFMALGVSWQLSPFKDTFEGPNEDRTTCPIWKNTSGNLNST